MMDAGVAGETRAAEREGVDAATKPLELERLAALSAELDLGAPRDALLAREGLSASRFAEAQELWLSRMAREATWGRFNLSTRYSDAFVAHRQALADGSSARPTAKEGLRPYAPMGLPPLDAASPSPLPPASASAPVFVAAPLPALESDDDDEDFQGTMVGEISPFARKPELPFQRGVAAVMATPEPKAPMPLPFRPAHEKASKSETIAMPAMPDLGSAMAGVRLSPLALRSSALPFQPATTETVDLPLEEEDEEEGGNATVVGTIENLRKAAELPFKHTPSSAPLAPSASSGLGGLPFRAAAEAQAAPRLTLEQFASLAAEIAVNPARLSEIRARYGLDEGAHRRESALHSSRFSADPALYRRFAGLFESYRDWLSRGGR